MALQSRTFAGDPALEACLLKDSAHILLGARGEHVAKIQAVIMLLDGASIDAGELKSRTYGPSTAAAVLAFKKKRKIINPKYQTQADNIVGKMTVQALDDELMAKQADAQPPGRGSGTCNVETGISLQAPRLAFRPARPRARALRLA